MAFKFANYAWAAAVTAALLTALYKDTWVEDDGSGGMLSASIQRSVSFPDHSAARFGQGDEDRYGRMGTNPHAFGSERSQSRPGVLGPIKRN